MKTVEIAFNTLETEDSGFSRFGQSKAYTYYRLNRVDFLRKSILYLKDQVETHVRTVLGRNPEYQYTRFKLPAQIAPKAVKLQINTSERTELLVNPYRTGGSFNIDAGCTWIRIDGTKIERGENVLCHNRPLDIRRAEITYCESTCNFGSSFDSNATTPIELATTFLSNLQRQFPEGVTGSGTCFTLYDYDNTCRRLPHWVWSDAPSVAALLTFGRKYKNQDAVKKAKRIGRKLLDYQISTGDYNGAFVSRYRMYGHQNIPMDCLLGPNDTSFVVRWALIPLAVETGEEQFITAAREGLEWVAETANTRPYLPSHYYVDREEWEDGAFVDTGFTPIGFSAYNAVFGREFDSIAEDFIDRFMDQFKLKNGYYGQNYNRKKGVNDRIFARGQGWVLAGLLETYEDTGKKKYLDEARRLSNRICMAQNKDGSWSYLLGYGSVDSKVQHVSGECEKSTAVLAYYLLRTYVYIREPQIKASATKALNWCTSRIQLTDDAGYGGIASRNLVSGITGLPYIKVATGYANAFYVLAQTLHIEIEEDKVQNRRLPKGYHV